MVNHLPRHQHDEFRPCTRGHDIEPIQAHEKLVFVFDRIWIAKREGGDDHVTLLPLKPFYRVHGAADVGGADTRPEDLPEPADDQPLLRTMRRDNPYSLLPEVRRSIRLRRRWPKDPCRRIP